MKKILVFPLGLKLCIWIENKSMSNVSIVDLLAIIAYYMKTIFSLSYWPNFLYRASPATLVIEL